MYARADRGKSGAIEGLRFGALIGVFVIGACVAHDYVILNIGLNLALVEASGQFFRMAAGRCRCRPHL
jgi:hypothetical protein